MKKVLVTEDDPIARKIICATCERCGQVTFQASSGRRAWEILKDNPDIALLVTDVAMPDMDGKELVRAIRADETLHRLPIIIVSGQVGPKEIANLLDDGASRFLPKPIDNQFLSDYLRALLHG